jgi:ADP-heptose:LPS heptosyltransferase
VRVDLGSEPIERITCLYVGRLGDVIVATPFLRALRRRFPRARVRLIVGSRAAEVLPLLPFIDEGLFLGRAADLGAHAGMARALAFGGRADLLVDLNSAYSSTSTFLARASRARLRLSFEKGKGPAVFNRTIPAPDVREHVSERFARLTEAIGGSGGPDLELRVPSYDQAEADALLDPLSKDAAAFKILIHPGNLGRRPSLWPLDRLTELCRRLQAADPTLRLFFLAGPGESEAVGSVAAALPKPGHVLPTAALGVVAGTVRRMDLLLGSLTSTTHLAAALGVPTFAFYEGYTQTVWRPRGARHGGTVSPDWDNVQATTVDEAWSALSEHLSRLKPLGRP